MRKIYSFMVAAVAMFTAASCAQEIDNPGQNKGEVIFTAYADGADTKTVLGKSDNQRPQSMWNGEEWIQIVGQNNYWMNTNTDEPSASATIFYNGNNGEFNETEGVYAVYPAGSEQYNNADGGVTGVTVPTKQTATVGSYDPAAAVAIAYTTDNELHFKNVTSLIKFQVATEGVKSVTFAPNGTENLPKLSGKCTVKADATIIPWITNEHESESYVELSAGEGTFETGKDYYIANFPCNLENGFKVEFSFDGSSKIEIATYNQPVELLRNQILNIGSLEGQAPVMYEWSVAGTFNNWNTSATPFEENGDYKVAKGVTFESNGKFKIVNNGSTWYNADGTFALNKWISIIANDGADINIEAGSYDFYLYGSSLQVVAAGSAAPFEPGVIPAEDGWVYLKPNSNWTQSNARFAIYFFGSGETWVSMEKVPNTSYYGVKISDIVAKGYTGMIFCRMNPSTTVNNWNNKWNQSGDLKVSDFTSGKNLFTVGSGVWDGATTTWGTITKLN